MARYHATVESRRSAPRRSGAVRLVTVWGLRSRGDRHGHIQSWRRQVGTAWLLLGRLSVGAEMTEQQPHEVNDHQVGFELRPRLQHSELAFPWFTCQLQRRVPGFVPATVSVRPGWRIRPSGPMPRTGSGISSRLSAKPEAPPASVFTAATEYSRPQ
jgi:hypothetical protein